MTVAATAAVEVITQGFRDAPGYRVTGHGCDSVMVIDAAGRRYRVSVVNDSAVRGTNVLYLSWSLQQPRVVDLAEVGDLGPHHPAFGQQCELCQHALGGGRPLSALVVGPTTAESRYRHYEGVRYSPACLILHSDCVNGEDRARC